MTTSKHLTLFELQRLVKGSLTESFPLPVWVAAEISELKVNYSGHCYLELIEKGESDGVPKAQARAVIWRSNYPRIAGYFEAEAKQKLAAGISVLLKVVVNYHELYGFSLQIIDIDASYTLGDMERRRQQTIAQLKEEGIWDLNREQIMPSVVQNIAIISSRNAAGYQDFTNSLTKSGYHFNPTLFDAFMQGTEAEGSIIAALYAIAKRMSEFDAVVIIRGGGSTSDLNCYNSYALSACVAQFPLPIITGIGHDKDVSVVDMVAHTPLKTPTAVAGWIVERSAQFEFCLDNAALQIAQTTQEIFTTQRLKLQRYTSQIESSTKLFIESRRQHLLFSEERLFSLCHNMLQREKQHLDTTLEILQSHSPERALRMGFSIIRHNGRAVTDAKSLKRGDRVDVVFHSGYHKATID